MTKLWCWSRLPCVRPTLPVRQRLQRKMWRDWCQTDLMSNLKSHSCGKPANLSLMFHVTRGPLHTPQVRFLYCKVFRSTKPSRVWWGEGALTGSDYVRGDGVRLQLLHLNKLWLLKWKSTESSSGCLFGNDERHNTIILLKKIIRGRSPRFISSWVADQSVTNGQMFISCCWTCLWWLNCKTEELLSSLPISHHFYKLCCFRFFNSIDILVFLSVQRSEHASDHHIVFTTIQMQVWTDDGVLPQTAAIKAELRW